MIKIEIKMRNKTLAAFLALFFGFLGVHRYYLGQTGLGILYFMLSFVGLGFIMGFIDFVTFLAMDKEVFDIKYNRQYVRAEYRTYGRDFARGTTTRSSDRPRPAAPKRDFRVERENAIKKQRAMYKKPVVKKKANPYKESGIEKFKDYDYEEAIVDFRKALMIDAADISVHFNLACAYSLIEEKEEAFYHLDLAVKYGLKDLNKIKNHDALAFLRIQDEFEVFEKNGYRLDALEEIKKPELVTGKGSSDLLEQLKRLGALRERGLLTEEEFTSQKKKLLY